MEVSCGSLSLKSPLEDFSNSVLMHHSIEFHFFHLHTFLMKSLMEDFSDTVDTWQLLLNYFHLSAQTYV